jgi:glycosyltransferase involved in cell wall biosynthesis
VKRPRTGYYSAVTDFAKVVVVVPAHNEVDDLPRCLRALATAAVCMPVPVLVVVVLDACVDASERLAGQFGPNIEFVSVQAGNVGAARAAGFRHSRSLCSDIDLGRVWYATTDADSVVPADWLVTMTATDHDMVLGVVRLPVWRHFTAEAVRRYLRGFHSNGRGHDHVHGANMGFRADAYWHVGGFRALATGEDRELVERFEAAGMRIRRDTRLSVTTSDRRDGRAPGGFAADLRGIAGGARRGSGERL